MADRKPSTADHGADSPGVKGSIILVLGETDNNLPGTSCGKFNLWFDYNPDTQYNVEHLKIACATLPVSKQITGRLSRGDTIIFYVCFSQRAKERLSKSKRDTIVNIMHGVLVERQVCTTVDLPLEED